VHPNPRVAMRGEEMGFLRDRGPGGTHHTMREQPFSFGEDFWTETDTGEKELDLKRDGRTVAPITKAFATPLRERFSIEIAPDEDDALILARTVCIDRMGHR
jgi:uncharacterized protein YxjI